MTTAACLASYTLAGTTIRYDHDPATGAVGLRLWPERLDAQVVDRDQPVSSLAHCKIVGDPYPGNFGQGRTMRHSPSVDRFRLAHHGNDGDSIVTELAAEGGCRIVHRLTPCAGGAFEVRVSFINDSDAPVRLEQLDSFALHGLTPFTTDDASGRLVVHRFRSSWAFEGRLASDPLERLHLERAGSHNVLAVERFGQVGTMPVRGWFPFVALEDAGAGVFWGAQLAWAGSWQLEVGGRFDGIDLAGGLADREFGHWTKTVAPGETLDAPPAVLACCEGTLDDLSHRLTSAQTPACEAHPDPERDLPITFNEWCTTWGSPTEQLVVALADRLAQLPVRYFVVDAGWFRGNVPGAQWFTCHGDWTPDEAKLPGGLASVAQAIRDRGMVPGLWFEWETLGRDSAAWAQDDQVLTRDGYPVVANARKWWDLNDPWVINYLDDHVIRQLRDAGFGYVKIDYNENLGVGSDHPDGLGEGLRRNVVGTYAAFARLRDQLPDLVIENCSSGGHRLEPSMLARSAMSSFSDAHETPELPIIAGALHYLLLPRQSQIWAVLHGRDSTTRLAYSLGATFLGRMGLSGDILDLDESQWALLVDACAAYQDAVPVIREGFTRHQTHLTSESWRHPAGWQAVVRSTDAQALVVVHTFAGAPATATVELPAGDWTLTRTFARPDAPDMVVDGNALTVTGLSDFDARVALLVRE